MPAVTGAIRIDGVAVAWTVYCSAEDSMPIRLRLAADMWPTVFSSGE